MKSCFTAGALAAPLFAAPAFAQPSSGRSNGLPDGFPSDAGAARAAEPAPPANVTNGSVYNRGNVGSDADHYIQGGGVRLLVPIKGGLGIGANAYLFTRDSHYELIDAANGLERHRDVDQRNPQVRVYRARSSVRGGGRSAGASNRGEGSTSVAARMLTALIGICNGGSRE